jgi:flagellar M-ring protein FliF
MSCEQEQNMATLFYNLDETNTAEITAFLQENKYKLDKDGRNILVPKDIVYEMRMSLAIAGLPQSKFKSYELFEKKPLGMTDFARDLNYRRAVETELARSIESFREVEQARVHVSIPNQTLLMNKREATGSVILRMRPGEVLQGKQIKGIQHLVESAIDGLDFITRPVSVLDDTGNLLTKEDGDKLTIGDKQ